VVGPPLSTPNRQHEARHHQRASLIALDAMMLRATLSPNHLPYLVTHPHYICSKRCYAYLLDRNAHLSLGLTSLAAAGSLIRRPLSSNPVDIADMATDGQTPMVLRLTFPCLLYMVPVIHSLALGIALRATERGNIIYTAMTRPHYHPSLLESIIIRSVLDISAVSPIISGTE
jgi:hypothetical protein